MTLPPVPHLALPDWGVVAVFGIVYLGMFLGGLPRLKLDRSGVALLGAIAMIAITGMGMEEAARAVDLPTLVLLFAFMVVSAQMRLGGFYTAVTRAVGEMPLGARDGVCRVAFAAAVHRPVRRQPCLPAHGSGHAGGGLARRTGPRPPDPAAKHAHAQ